MRWIGHGSQNSSLSFFGTHSKVFDFAPNPRLFGCGLAAMDFFISRGDFDNGRQLEVGAESYRC